MITTRIADLCNKGTPMTGMKSLGRVSAKALGRILLTLALIGTLFLSACAQSFPEGVASPLNEYSQTAIKLPSGIEYIESLQQTDNGTLWMVGSKNRSELDSAVSVWELDGNDSWNKIADVDELLGLEEHDYVVASPITKSSEVLCAVINNKASSSWMRFYLIDPELEDGYREIPIDVSQISEGTYSTDIEPAYEVPDSKPLYDIPLYPSALRVSPLKNDRFLVRYLDQALFVLDAATGSIQSIPLSLNKHDVISAVELDDATYVLYRDKGNYSGAFKVGSIDVVTGDITTLDDKPYQEFKAVFDEHVMLFDRLVDPDMKSDPFGAGERITFSLNNGVFEYRNNEVRKIADAEGTVLADLRLHVRDHVFVNENDFYLVSDDDIGGLPPAGDRVEQLPPGLYKYERRADA